MAGVGLSKGAQLRPGKESRAAIAQALLTAGASGLSYDDLAILVKLTPTGVRWHMDRMRAEVFIAHTKDTRKTRVFHATFATDGQAYLAACSVGRQRPGGPAPATFLRVLSMVQCAGAGGIGIKDLMSASGLARPTMNIIMPTLVREHGVQMRRDAKGKGRAARYWPAGCTPIVDVAPLKPTRHMPAPKDEKPPKQAMPDVPRLIIIPSGVKRTVCPSGKDQRFTVHKAEPFFSAMKPGSYLLTGSAIERAYCAATAAASTTNGGEA